MAPFNIENFHDFILDQGIVGFHKEPIQLRSGRLSYWYANWGVISYETATMGVLADFVLDYCFDHGLYPSFFYGVPEGASPLALLTQYKYAHERLEDAPGHPLLMGRKQAKEHGAVQDRFFIGKAEGSCVLLEDITTTGDSLIEEIKKLQKIPETHLIRALSLLDRNEVREDGQTVSEAIFSRTGIYHRSLTSAKEILPLAYERLQPGKEIAQAIEQEYKKQGIIELHLL